MAMQRQLWSLSGVAVELGIDRRTLASALDGVEPDGTRSGFPAWYMESALNAIAGRKKSGKPRSRDTQSNPVLEAMADRVINWREVYQRGGPVPATIDDIAEWYDAGAGDVLNWLRAGMPYIVEGDFESGEGFVLSPAWTIDWVLMTTNLARATSERTLLRRLALDG